MTAPPRKLGLTPAKGALMALLAIGLCVVWGPQLASLGSEEAPPTTRRRPPGVAAASKRTPRRGVAKPATTPTKPRLQSESKPKKPTAEIGLADAVSYDPFAPPAWSPDARRSAAASGVSAGVATQTELEERFETVRSSGVAMILVSDTGQAVQIGGKTLRVGDQLEGFEIVKISPAGVVFQPATADKGDDRGA